MSCISSLFWCIKTNFYNKLTPLVNLFNLQSPGLVVVFSVFKAARQRIDMGIVEKRMLAISPRESLQRQDIVYSDILFSYWGQFTLLRSLKCS